MNKLLSLFIILSTIQVNAQGIEFSKGSWDEIVTLAKDQNKPIVVDAYTTWCGPCKWMAKNTFTDSLVGVFVNEHFIPYKMDMEKGEGIDFAKKNNVRAYPTILFFDPSGILIHKAVGAKNADQFRELCEQALDPALNLNGYKELYDGGERDKEFLRGYTKVLMNARENSDTVFDEYWGMLEEDEKISKDVFLLIRAKARGFENYNDPLFKFFMDHKSEYEQVLDEETIKYALFNAYHGNIYTASKIEDKEAQTRVVEDLKMIFPENAHEIKEFMYYTKAQRLKDEKMLKKATDKYMDVTTNSGILNTSAWNIYETSDKKKDLKKALGWINKSIDITESYYNLDTKAAILYKLENYTDAKLFIDKALASAKENELTVDLSMSEALKEKIDKELQAQN